MKHIFSNRYSREEQNQFPALYVLIFLVSQTVPQFRYKIMPDSGGIAHWPNYIDLVIGTLIWPEQKIAQ